MKCQSCGSVLEPVTTDLPFKVSEKTIVILKALPVLQCRNCAEYLLEDEVLRRVEEIMAGVDRSAELEIRNFAA
jgi:YgiT-type zinc finger domain-containing protein